MCARSLKTGVQLHRTPTFKPAGSELIHCLNLQQTLYTLYIFQAQIHNPPKKNTLIYFHIIACIGPLIEISRKYEHSVAHTETLLGQAAQVYLQL